MLLSTPKGNTALMFIWFILKECGIKVTSLSTLRAFKVPGHRGLSNNNIGE